MSIARVIHVGTPKPSTEPFEESVLVHFHDFANLPCEKGTKVESPTFICAGHEWFLELYPGGSQNADEGKTSIYLGCRLTSKIVVDFDISVKKSCGDKFFTLSAIMETFPIENNKSFGWADYEEREDILNRSTDLLNNGALTFEVRIKPHMDYYCNYIKSTPSMSEKIFSLFLDEDSSDVAIKVNGRVFFAHKAILKAQIPHLLELVDTCDKQNPLPIKDVDPNTFEIMLKSVYGSAICASEWIKHSRHILVASGKYGFTDLKLEAEAWYVKNLKLTVNNVIDELLYADGAECPMLKKAAIDFIVKNGEGLMESESYEKLDESPHLRKEVMRASFSATANKK